MNEDVFEITEEMLPSGLIQDKITNTRSISEVIAKEKNKVIRNIMYMVESNFSNDSNSEQGYKRVRKTVLDNVNDLTRYFQEEILMAIFSEANNSIDSLIERISELETEKRELLAIIKENQKDDE